MREAFGRLMRQAINQIDIDAVKAERARGLQKVARQFEWLVAVDRLLHLGMKILDAHAEPVEAEPAECFQVRPRGHARVDLDADFGVLRKSEALASGAEEVFYLFRRQISWRSSAPVKLNHGPFARHAAADALHFFLQHIEVGRRDALIFLDDHVARAEKAQALAKRNVHVERNRRARLFGLGMHFFQIVWTKGLVPHWRGWIARIARARAVVAHKKFLTDMQFVAHLLQAWVSECHFAGLLLLPSERLHCGLRLVQSSFLRGLDKKLGIFDRRILNDAVSEI